MKAIVLLITLIFLPTRVPLRAQNFDFKSIDANDTQATQPQNKLPNAPKPQKPSTPEQRKISRSGKLPAILAPQITKQPLDAADKFHLYLHQAFNPVSFLLPMFGVGLKMADPPGHYPREWKDGAGSVGRLYGDSLAKRQSQLAAQTLAEITFREDPRYLPSASQNAFVRIAHAVAFVIIDRSDSGHNRLALSNFSGAAANGFVGMAYLPSGYDDLTHAGQRAASTFQGFAISNIANEFCPEWGPIMTRMHLPFVHPPCAERIKAKHSNAATSAATPKEK